MKKVFTPLCLLFCLLASAQSELPEVYDKQVQFYKNQTQYYRFHGVEVEDLSVLYQNQYRRKNNTEKLNKYYLKNQLVQVDCESISRSEENPGWMNSADFVSIKPDGTYLYDKEGNFMHKQALSERSTLFKSKFSFKRNMFNPVKETQIDKWKAQGINYDEINGYSYRLEFGKTRITIDNKEKSIEKISFSDGDEMLSTTFTRFEQLSNRLYVPVFSMETTAGQTLSGDCFDEISISEYYGYNFQQNREEKQIDLGVSFDIYPNPVTDILQLNLPENSKSISILTLNGEIIFSEQADYIGKLNIPVDFLESGTYLIQIRSNENVLTEKFVKL